MGSICANDHIHSTYRLWNWLGVKNEGNESEQKISANLAKFETFEITGYKLPEVNSYTKSSSGKRKGKYV